VAQKKLGIPIFTGNNRQQMINESLNSDDAKDLNEKTSEL
jgi:hypothetical protein